jgi:methionyl-tRNA formyltransferase
MNILFLGTDHFAVPSLEALAERHRVAAVVTQPDKPRGRGKKVSPTPVKIAAERLGIPVMEPKSLKGAKFCQEISRLDFDIVVLVAYGRLLPEDFLCRPQKGCICLHPSKLPQYRGCSPIECAILDGRKSTGISVFKIDREFDTGDVIFQKDMEIGEDETGGSLRERLSRDSAGVLLEALDSLEKGEAQSISQDNGQASWAPKITREDGRIDWGETAERCRNRIRAFNPKPGAFTTLRGKIIKVLKADVAAHAEGESLPPGTIAGIEKNKGLRVSCGEGALTLTQVQPEGKAPMSGWAFVLGSRPQPGERLE